MSAKRRARTKRSSLPATKGVQSHSTAKRLSVDKKVISKDIRKKVKRGAKGRVPPGPLTGWRLWLFRLIAVTVVPVLLFVLVELSLRATGQGFRPDAIIECEVNGKAALSDNVKFGWRFFPRPIARELVPFVFAAAKPEDTYRIFVLGASAVKGEPDAAFSFGRILRVLLGNKYPGLNFEIINVAMPAINSHVVVELAKDCVKHDPDLFVVYLGNNEVTGPYGAGSVFTPLASNLSLIRAGVVLRSLRFGQILTRFIERAHPVGNRPAVWRGLEMFLEKQVRATDKRLQSGYQHFARNLKDIIGIVGSSGSKMILCTVGSNLKDCPPFASLHRLELGAADRTQWEELYQEGVSREQAGDHAEAIERYLAAAEIDSHYADLQFRLGRCYWALAKYEKARERYIRARELDTLRFRADTRINEIIRDSADNEAHEGVYLVDAVRTFEKNSPHNVPGEELFYEHVHMNFKGNTLLAKALFEQIDEILPERIRRERASDPSLLTEAECAQRLAYTDWTRHNNAYKILNFYIKKPPFTNQLYHEERVSQMERKLERLEVNLTPQAHKNAATLYEQLLEKEPSDIWFRWRYAELLSVHLRDESSAAKQVRLTQELLPNSYRPHLLLAMSLERQGHRNEAIEHLWRVIQIKPTSANAYHRLGMAYHAQARIDQAIRCYSKAIRLQPDNGGAYKGLAVLLSRQGKVDQAVDMLREGTLSIPDDALMHVNLGVLLNRQKQRDEAIKELRIALQIDPNSTETRRILESILKSN